MGTEITQLLQERFRTTDGPLTVLLKIDTEGDKTRCAGNLFQYFTIWTEKAPLLRRRRLGLAVIGRCALVARLGAGGGRSHTGWGQLHFWKFRSPGWGQLGGVCVPAKRGWVGEAFPHMARDEDRTMAQHSGMNAFLNSSRKDLRTLKSNRFAVLGVHLQWVDAVKVVSRGTPRPHLHSHRHSKARVAIVWTLGIILSGRGGSWGRAEVLVQQRTQGIGVSLIEFHSCSSKTRNYHAHV